MAASMGRTNLTRFRLNILTKIGKGNNCRDARTFSDNRNSTCKRVQQTLSKNHRQTKSTVNRNWNLETNFQYLCIRLYSSSSPTDTEDSGQQSDISTSEKSSNIEENGLVGNIEESVLKENLGENRQEENQVEDRLEGSQLLMQDDHSVSLQELGNKDDIFELEPTEENGQKENQVEERLEGRQLLMQDDPGVSLQELGNKDEVFELKPTEENKVELYSEQELKQVVFEEEADKLYIRIDFSIKSIDRSVLKSYLMFLQMAAQGLDVQFESKQMPKFLVERESILKSAHIYKKHYRQYERRTHLLNCSIHKVTGSTASVFLEYIQRNLPEGIAMQVEKHQIDMVPEHLNRPIKEAEPGVV